MNKKLPLLQRECGMCRACCTTQHVEHVPTRDGATTPKYADVPCPHLNPNMNAKGCTIHSTKPEACRTWMCVWRSGSNIVNGNERPDYSGVVLDTVLNRGLTFSFLCAVAVEPENAKECFSKAEGMLTRLAEKHLVVCEYPDGYQEVKGPTERVEEYVRVCGRET